MVIFKFYCEHRGLKERYLKELDSPVLCSPSFNEAHTDGAHSGKLVNSLKSLVDRLGE